jgi:predicted nucleic acid-binding Zn ribbon protein
MQYECSECGHFMRLGLVERETVVKTCPACEESARFKPAFEGEGVSF